jgi:flavin-dependent dehydrogenase
MAVPIVACLVAPAASIASSTNLSISSLLSLYADAASNRSGRSVNPAAAIRNFHATKPVPSSNEPATVVVRVYGTGLPPLCRYLIAADGAKGPMAKWLGFKDRKRRLAGALEAEIPATVEKKTTIHFEFGLIKNGYIWNFPKDDGYSIGVGTFIGGEPQDFKKILDEYAQFFNVDVKNSKQYGHPLCIWDGNQKLHTQNAVLAGEAACVVDPFTAEGIRPSIFSGVLAAGFIHDALSGDANALANYTDAINGQWGTDMAWAQKLAGAFYRFPGVGYKVGVKRPSGAQIMGKILCGELRYGDVAGRALKRLIPGFG